MKTGVVQHIEISPNVCGGRPRIAGHRVRVQDIVEMHEALGLTPDEIVSDLTGITLSDVYAALSYYHDHRDQIHSDVKADERLVGRVQLTNISKLAR